MIRIDISDDAVDFQPHSVSGWGAINKEIVVRLRDTGDIFCNYILAITTLTEAILCVATNVTHDEIRHWLASDPDNTQFDVPPDAPHYEQNFMASLIGTMLASKIGVDWSEYEEKLQALIER